MKRKTKDNILHYVVATVVVSVFLLIALSLCIGVSWLSDKIGLPIYTIVLIAGFIYLVYTVGQLFKMIDDKEE